MTPKTLREKMMDGAEKFSEEMFSCAEHRSVSRYCNSETYAHCFEAGADLAFRLIVEELRTMGRYAEATAIESRWAGERGER
jgi:hypothetical protein